MSTIKENKAELKPPDTHEGAASNLSELEKLEAEEQKRPRAAVIHGAVRTGGEEELNRTVSSLAWSGIASGLSMGFSLVAEGLLRSYLPETHWRPLITKLGYPFGFLIVAVFVVRFLAIHPFQDGNGRLHRCLIHHVLAERKFAPPGMAGTTAF